MRARWFLLAIAIAYVALFARAIGFDYVWDDVHEIAQNPTLDGPLVGGLGATQMAKNDAALVELANLELAYDSYRPLLFASYWADVHLFGRGPAPLHATNLALGLLAIGLAYRVARRWLRDDRWALIVPALLALHPIAVEPVAYISGRADVLAAVFALAAIELALAAIDREATGGAIARALGAAGLFAASLASKEGAVALPLVVLALAAVRGRLARRWWVALALAVAGGAYLAVRAQIVTASAVGSGATGGAIRILPDVWLGYLRTAIAPIALSSEHRPTAMGLVGWVVVVALAGVVVLGLVRAGRTWRTHALATVAIGLAWMALLVAPAAVAIQMTGVIADRYLYLPLVGLGLALAAALRALAGSPRARAVYVGVGAWGLALVVLAALQVGTWRDNRALYQRAVDMEPDSSEAQYRRAYLDVLADDWQAALPRLTRAVELDDHNTRALNNLGVGLLRIGDFADAEPVLAKAVEQNPAYFRSWLNLGLARAELGRRAEGCAAIARALAINPSYAAARREQERRCR